MLRNEPHFKRVSYHVLDAKVLKKKQPMLQRAIRYEFETQWPHASYTQLLCWTFVFTLIGLSRFI